MIRVLTFVPIAWLSLVLLGALSVPIAHAVHRTIPPIYVTLWYQYPRCNILP